MYPKYKLQVSMFIFKNVARYLQFNKLVFSYTQTCYIHNKYFHYFRDKEGYKNSVVQLNNVETRLIISGFDFLKGRNVHVEEFLSHLLRRENVMKLSTSQLKEAITLLANSKFDSEKYEDALRHIDEKCAMNVERWPLNFSLYVLDAWFIILGPRIFRKHYYCALTNLLSKKMKRCSKQNLMLILYFIGMSKRSPPFLMELISYKLENFLTDLSDEEWAIACLSFFKIGTKMNSNVLLDKSCKTAKNLMLKNDNFNLINVLKCLRLSEHFEQDLMSKLDEYVRRAYTKFNFVECTNFLATFATQNIYSYETYRCLEDHGISQLSKEDVVTEFNDEIAKIHPSERSRVKDLARFLWAMAFVGHNINHKSINFMLEILYARIKSGEFKPDIPVLIDCLQSFILCGHYPLNMIEYALQPIFIEQILNSNKAKPKYQLYFINRSAYIENCISDIKNKGFMNIPKNLEKEVLERKGFQELLDFLDKHLKENCFTCCYVMPHIMISGIVLATNPKENNPEKLITPTLLKLIENGIISKSIQDILHIDKIYTCIEILDPTVCVHGNTMPLGLMKSKIYQLQKLNFNVITVTSDEISQLVKTNKNECASEFQNLFM